VRQELITPQQTDTKGSIMSRTLRNSEHQDSTKVDPTTMRSAGTLKKKSENSFGVIYMKE